MYDDIIDLAMDQQLLTEINNKINYKRLPIWRELHSKTEEEIKALEKKLSNEGKLTFDILFNEPIGYYFIKSYLQTQHSIDKAIFIHDVEIYKTLNDYDARKETVHKIYDTFCGPEIANRKRGTSCLSNKNIINDISKSKSQMSSTQTLEFPMSTTVTHFNENSKLTEPVSEVTEYSLLPNPNTTTTINDQTPLKIEEETNNHITMSENQKLSTNISDDNTTDLLSQNEKSQYEKSSQNEKQQQEDEEKENNNNNFEEESERIKSQSRHSDKTGITTTSFFSDDSNAIGCYGKCLRRLKERMNLGDYGINIFDEIVFEILTDLKLDVFPRFLKCSMFDMYLRCKSLEYKLITINSFHPMRMLGRGAFGTVNACKKKDTGRLYAMKQIDKRRVQATDSISSLIAERDFLSLMDCRFVTSLKYAFMDDDRLYLIMDLMTGGDLKYHLNHDGIFEESRSRFYCAQILLGIEHIHSKGIIYRDLKLENVLVDERGNIKISDLGLAVSLNDGLVRGYAGTPGYTAPEVVLTQYYNQQVDFFSFGVVIYRSLCGKKPFAKKKTNDMRQNEIDRLRKTSIELDRNVVEMLVDYDNSRFTPKIKNLCRGLLNKNPSYRLGFNGFNEIKNHPWFDCIDWGLLEAGYLKPPFVPAGDEINAEQQQYIGRPPDDDKYNKIKITQEFNQSLNKFPFKSSKVIQSELVDVLEKVHSDRRQSKDFIADDINKLYAFPTPHENTGKHHCLGGCIIV